jgi:hypothetical protein
VVSSFAKDLLSANYPFSSLHQVKEWLNKALALLVVFQNIA